MILEITDFVLGSLDFGWCFLLFRKKLVWASNVPKTFTLEYQCACGHKLVFHNLATKKCMVRCGAASVACQCQRYMGSVPPEDVLASWHPGEYIEAVTTPAPVPVSGTVPTTTRPTLSQYETSDEVKAAIEDLNRSIAIAAFPLAPASTGRTRVRSVRYPPPFDYTIDTYEELRYRP